MKVRIHRGATEVGGSCVELEARGERLVLDLGLPLASTLGEQPPLPAVPGFDGSDDSLLGVVISHPHPDHYGLVPRIDPKVPILIGVAAEAVLKESTFFTGAEELPEASAYLADRVPLQQGPFRITPYLVDHSAFDSYALLVEAHGRRLLYSGDLRGHGRKPGAFSSLLKRPPEKIDALLLEGTTIGREPGRGLATEQEVEEQLAESFGRTEGMALALYSPQNVDRLVSVFKAARRAGRTLVLDLYAASVAKATGRSTIPKPGFEGLRVYVPQRQRVLVKEAREFERVNQLGESRIFKEELASDPAGYVMTFRHSMGRELAEQELLSGARATWLMWPGYLEADGGRALKRWLDQQGIELGVAHSSGHATVEDLTRMAEAVNAARVVPIHTEAPEAFDQYFERVEIRPDGEWWEV